MTFKYPPLSCLWLFCLLLSMKLCYFVYHCCFHRDIMIITTVMGFRILIFVLLHTLPLPKLSLLRSTGSSNERNDPLPPDSPPSIDTWSSTDEASPALPEPSSCRRSFSRLASLDDVFDVGDVPTSPVEPLSRRSLSELRDLEFLDMQHPP